LVTAAKMEATIATIRIRAVILVNLNFDVNSSPFLCVLM